MVRLSAGEKKRRLIVDVCKRLFYLKGYCRTTYGDICREADIPPGTITYHFGGKAGIAAAIEVEFEAQNKTYIEGLCGDRFSKAELMAIENFNLWKRLYDDANLMRFLREITAERIPARSVHQVVKGFYRCVMDERGTRDIDDRMLDLMVTAQIGTSDALVGLVAASPERYRVEELAQFMILFFLRQIGVGDGEAARLIERGQALFHQLPIDNRYFAGFAYDERFIPLRARA